MTKRLVNAGNDAGAAGRVVTVHPDDPLEVTVATFAPPSSRLHKGETVDWVSSLKITWVVALAATGWPVNAVVANSSEEFR